jgi:hypothetical protein
MTERIVVSGADAAGMSAAVQAKRIDTATTALWKEMTALDLPVCSAIRAGVRSDPRGVTAVRRAWAGKLGGWPEGGLKINP